MRCLSNVLTTCLHCVPQVVKKIDETRKRANQIVSQRQRNIMSQQAKEERQRQQMMQEEMKRQMNRRAKDTANETVANSKLSAFQMQKMKALDAKA